MFWKEPRTGFPTVPTNESWQALLSVRLEINGPDGETLGHKAEQRKRPCQPHYGTEDDFFSTFFSRHNFSHSFQTAAYLGFEILLSIINRQKIPKSVSRVTSFFFLTMGSNGLASRQLFPQSLSSTLSPSLVSTVRPSVSFSPQSGVGLELAGVGLVLGQDVAHDGNDRLISPIIVEALVPGTNKYFHLSRSKCLNQLMQKCQ
jgi:hypothetical protein